MSCTWGQAIAWIAALVGGKGTGSSTQTEHRCLRGKCWDWVAVGMDPSPQTQRRGFPPPTAHRPLPLPRRNWLGPVPSDLGPVIAATRAWAHPDMISHGFVGMRGKTRGGQGPPLRGSLGACTTYGRLQFSVALT